MSKTVAQIFATNPTTVVADTDLYYLVQSPYTPGTDAAITGANLKIAFGTGGTINPGLANQIAYYATAGSSVSGLTIANNGVLVTNGTGVPSISTTLPSGLTIPGYAHSGANSDITSMIGLTGKLEQPTAIADTGARNVLAFSYAGSAVNYLDVSNAATGAEINLSAQGTDPNVTMRIQSKGNKWLEMISQTGTTVIKLWPNTSGLNLFKVGFDIPTISADRTLTIPDADGTIALTSQLLSSPLTTKGDLWGWSTTNARLPVGTINGQILQVASGATLGLAYSTATYPSTATNVARILRSDGTNYVDTTSTFADTYTASSILYANGANNVAGLTTANNGLLVTSNTGVPSLLAGPGTTGNMLISNAAAAPSFTTFTYPTTVGASGSIHISNGTNIVSSTSLWPNTVGTSGKFLISDGTSNGYSTSTIPTSAGATANKLLLSDGTNYVLSTPTFPNASATTRKITISDGTNWVASTETYAAPGTSGNVMTSDGTNWTSAAASSGTGRLLNIQVFTSSGTYTKTTGTNTALVKAWGAGGGGGANQNALFLGGAGGAGAYVEGLVSVSGTVTITIPTGGTGATANTSNNGGAASADTSYGATVIAKSGSAGGGANGGAAGGPGGVAASCTVPAAGYALSGGNGSGTNVFSGFNTITFAGSSPNNTPFILDAIPQNGLANSGQGGSGGSTGTNGGNGGSGLIVIYEYS